MGGEKNCDFRLKWPYISEMVQDRLRGVDLRVGGPDPPNENM